ncbi:MAG: DUF2892 domain-containing protein [Bacillota bacterium]
MHLDFEKNLGITDRGIRVSIGAILLGVVLMHIIVGWWATVAVIFALFQFVEAALGY